MKSLDQIRAAAAYREIERADEKAIDLARRLPDMLRINGLLGTWAFLLVKQAKQATPLQTLVDHLRSMPGLAIPPKGDAPAVFLHWVGGARGSSGGVTGPELRALTAETLAFAGWLKRAAEARPTADAAEEADSAES